MSDKLFAPCCVGTAEQHAIWEPCLRQIEFVGGLQAARRIVLSQRDDFNDPAYAGGPVGAFNEILKALDAAIQERAPMAPQAAQQ